MLLTPFLMPLGAARSQGADSTTVVFLITVREGQPIAPAIAMMKEIMAHIAKQPGLIDQTLLASSFPGNKPSHVHLSRWRSISDWKEPNKSAEFLDLLPRTGRYFDFKPAEVLQPVR